MNGQNLTDEQRKDVEERVKGFSEKYDKLIDEFQVDLLMYPQYMPNAGGAFTTVISSMVVDKKYHPQAKEEKILA